MRRPIVGLLVLSMSSVALCAPLTPTITGFDFNFGAFNAPGPIEYMTNGALPDTLTYVPGAAHTEVTAFWPGWPAPPTFPVFNGAGAFGGDLAMSVMFTGQDAPYVGPGGVIDVSLTGTGANAGGAPDLVITGAIPGLGIPFGPLWMLDLDRVSLYGYSGPQWPPGPNNAYVLEGVGTIVGGFVPQQFNLIGRTGVMRGHLDFIDRVPIWIPPLYDPTNPIQYQVHAAYSGETGVGYVVPEPSSIVVLGGAILALARRRRKV